jgi:photosystem I subunit 2
MKKNDLKLNFNKIFRIKMIDNTTTNYFPEFGGSTGGWLQAAETEEKYVMTWVNDKNTKTVEENIFEMPTGGAAIMRQSENLLYLARKEQCLALSTQLKTSFKISNYKIYRIFPSGEVQYLHPKDGVLPEKVNAGRVGVGNVSHSIGKNLNPSQIKFTTKSFSD